MRDYLKAINPGREKAAPMFKGILKILTADELITQRAEKALTYLLDFNFRGDPNGEAQRVWTSLMCDVNQSVLGGEALDPRWAQEIMRKILELLLLTHEASSRGQLIKLGKTKRGRTPVRQSGALPRKPAPAWRFRHGGKNVVKGVVNHSVFLQFMIGIPFISVWSSCGGFSF